MIHEQPNDWRGLAACRDTVTGPDGDPFYSPDDTREPAEVAARRELAALAVCARCPVRAECLAYAVASGQQHGVWGGRTERQVRALVKRAGTRPAVVDNGAPRGMPIGSTRPNARRTHCKQGHPLVGSNVYVSPKGKRACLACRRAAARAQQTRRRELAWLAGADPRRTA